MTTPPAINTDNRVIVAALAANEAVRRPGLITATGRAAPSRFVVLPAGADPSFALMPHIDFVDAPDRRPGCGFAGGRLSSFAPFLAPGQIPAPTRLAVELRRLPDSRDAILRELRASAGLWYAPGALFARAAWSDVLVANLLDRLRCNGLEARLLVAHGQGILAARKMWLTVEWNVGLQAGEPLTIASGAAAVGRALIDAIAIIDQLAITENHDTRPGGAVERGVVALLTGLHHFVRHLTAAERAPEPVIAQRKLARAVQWARDLLDAIGVFAVTDDSPRKRWGRLASMVGGKRVRDHAGPAGLTLDQLSRDLERLHCAKLGTRLERSGWRIHVRRALLRLALPDRLQRLDLLDRVRCDLIYTAAMSRRLDRLYALFPWLAAPHGAFPDCAGGGLGAVASLIECARGFEIGRDMQRRLADPGQRRGMVPRLTVQSARAIYALPRNTVIAAGRSYAAGAALVQQVTSHVMAEAALRGEALGPGLAITEVGRGNLAYNDAAAFKVASTREAVVAIHQAQPAFEVTSRDNDLVRHMGLTLVRHCAAMVHAIFPTTFQRTNFIIHRLTIHNGIVPSPGDRKDDNLRGPWDDLSKFRAHQELTRSMLRTIDAAPGDDADLRDAIKGLITELAGSVEAQRAATLRETPSRNHGSYEEQDEGQGLAVRASKESTTSGARGATLRDLAADAGRWRDVDQRNPQPAPPDDLFEDILRGRADLAQLEPVSDLFLPILWFAPLIDRDRLGWIARGMPGQTVPEEPATHAEKLKTWLDAMRAYAPAAYAGAIVSGRDDHIACHLFTGVSPVTADLAHVLPGSQ